MEGQADMIDSRYGFFRLAMLLPLIAAGSAVQGEQNVTATAARPTNPSPSPPPAAATTAAKRVPQLPSPSEAERQAGIQVARLGLTAAGGLVDVRFKVLDAAKARALLANPTNSPMLIAGDKPPLMAPHNALRGARFSNGQVFFILYPNVRGAVRAGVPVTVAMGPVRLGPVTAQ
jgi:hypothetical protein